MVGRCWRLEGVRGRGREESAGSVSGMWHCDTPNPVRCRCKPIIKYRAKNVSDQIHHENL